MSDLAKFNEIKKLLLEENYEEVQSIIDDGIDADMCDEEENNILHLIATIKGTEEGANLDSDELADLLSSAIDSIEVSNINAKGEYPLVAAAKAGQARMVDVLFFADVSLAVDYADDNGDNIFLLLLNEKVDDEECASAVEEILGEAEDFLYSQDSEKGDTPLHKAARYGLLQTAEVLIDWGAETDTTNDFDGAPASELAALAGHSRLAKLLDYDYNDPELWDAEFSFDEDDDDPRGEDHAEYASCRKAIEDSDNEMLNNLLSSGFDANREDYYGQTLLFNAAASNNLEAIKILINHGADINHKDNSDDTVLGNIYNRDYAIVEYLINQASDLSTLDTHLLDFLKSDKESSDFDTINAEQKKALVELLSTKNVGITSVASQNCTSSGALGDEEFQHKVMSININKLFDETKMSLYESVRKYWKLSPKRANDAEYILAEFQGKIKSVFKANEKGWQKSEEHEGRYFFEGEEVFDEEITKLYVGKKVIKLKGQANPVRYWYK